MARPDLARIIRRLYEVFRKYDRPPQTWCGFCYTAEAIELFRRTPPDQLSDDHARQLLWETSDHWESSEGFRHFLPRMLEILAPPVSGEDLYDGHLLETVGNLGFQTWPEEERQAVLDFLDALEEAPGAGAIPEFPRS